MSQFTTKQIAGIALLLLAAVVLALLRIMTYRDPVAGGMEFGWPDEIVWRYRWTPVVVGVIVGGSLAISGVMLQALLRNPLAEPFILGLSSGAGLGVMAAMYAAYALGSSLDGIASRSIAAIAGGLLTLAIVYALGQRRGLLDPLSLVLVGVIVSAICGAGIMFFQHLVPTGLSGEFTRWLMGNIPLTVDAGPLIAAGTLAMCGLVVGTLLGRAMDAATIGDDEARSIGLSIGPLRLTIFVLAGILAAVTVSLAGPIGFVGLIGPHAARLILGPRHGPLVIGAALCGIILVIGADVARQVFDLGAGRMPIGIFTAIIGGPAFIWLLLSGRGQAERMSISIQHLDFAYGSMQVLRDIAVEARAGRIVAVLGPNAAGKSTLLRCMIGAIQPQCGSVLIDGRSVHELSPRELAKRIAYVPQRSIVSAAFTVRQVVELGRYALPASAERVEQAINALDLQEIADRPYLALSVGQQQRVTLARALAQLPRESGNLILDEPTAAMDLRHVASCASLLRATANSGAMVMMAVHDLSLAAAMADDVWLLDEGRLIAAGPVAEVMTQANLERVLRLDLIGSAIPQVVGDSCR